jgi:hypothetical protein
MERKNPKTANIQAVKCEPSVRFRHRHPNETYPHVMTQSSSHLELHDSGWRLCDAMEVFALPCRTPADLNISSPCPTPRWSTPGNAHSLLAGTFPRFACSFLVSTWPGPVHTPRVAGFIIVCANNNNKVALSTTTRPNDTCHRNPIKPCVPSWFSLPSSGSAT